MAFKILKGVPMPAPSTNKYNFDLMDVSDMMFVPLEGEETDDNARALQNRVGSAASAWGKRQDPPRMFATQLIQHEGKYGCGVWRQA